MDYNNVEQLQARLKSLSKKNKAMKVQLRRMNKHTELMYSFNNIYRDMCITYKGQVETLVKELTEVRTRYYQELAKKK